MALDFNNKIMVTNPTSYVLGQGVLCVGIMAIAASVITYFIGDFLMPATAWCAFGIPTSVVGGIVMGSGLTRN